MTIHMFMNFQTGISHLNSVVNDNNIDNNSNEIINILSIFTVPGVPFKASNNFTR